MATVSDNWSADGDWQRCPSSVLFECRQVVLIDNLGSALGSLVKGVCELVIRAASLPAAERVMTTSSSGVHFRMREMK